MMNHSIFVKKEQTMKILIFFSFFTSICFGQFEKTDSIGNFYVIKNKLVWQKHYELGDINILDNQLKKNHLTSNLDILDFETSAISDPFTINGNNLPQYAQSDIRAFIVLDIFNDNYRVSIKNITFPDFVEEHYYNGIKQNSRSGSLEHYLLRQDALIKRNNATINLLYTFDNFFSKIFDSKSILIED